MVARKSVLVSVLQKDRTHRIDGWTDRQTDKRDIIGIGSCGYRS